MYNKDHNIQKGKYNSMEQSKIIDTLETYHAPPPATVQLALSMGSCSTTPPRATVHPALHGVVLFIQPSTGSCSSSPNRLDRLGSCSSRGNTTGSYSSTPTAHCSSFPQHSLFIQRQHRSASVSSSIEGIARLGSVNSHRSIARVQ